MHDEDLTTPPQHALAGALSDLSDLIRSAAGRRGRDPEPREAKQDRGVGTESGEEVTARVQGLLRDAAARYEKLQAEAKAALGTDVSIPRLLQLARARSSGDVAEEPSGVTTALARLFSGASASLVPVSTPLAGRLDAGAVAVYETFVPTFHPSSLRTTIGDISGEWVRRPSDGIAGTPDIRLNLLYAHTIAAPRVLVPFTWVGAEKVQVVVNGTAWTSTPLSASDGRTIGHRYGGPVMTPVDGIVKLVLEVTKSPTTGSRHDVWIRTGPSSKPEEEDTGPIVVAPTPLPTPVPNPIPTGHPNDFLAALDPDKWRTLDDRVTELVRTTLRDFEGVLDRIDFSSERGLFREIGAALRGGSKG